MNANSLLVRPLPMFIADVAVILSRDLNAPDGFLDLVCGGKTHAQRCGVYRSVGLTPEQAAMEFVPFIEALAMRPRESFRDTMDLCRQKIREIEERS